MLLYDDKCISDRYSSNKFILDATMSMRAERDWLKKNDDGFLD